jgi:putative PIN family toxin of toxin-antitoxin system
VKVVFDSNIYVSAFAVRGGVAERALDAAMEGAFQLALSRPIVAEVLGVLARKFARTPEELARLAVFMSSLGEFVFPSSHVEVLSDSADNRILECALAARADIIVSGDREMLALGRWKGMEVLSLRQFVDRLESAGEVRQSRARYAVA